MDSSAPPPTGKRVEAGHHRLQQHQVAVEHHEQQHGGVAEEAPDRAGLGVGGRVEKAGIVQAHLQADHLTRQLDRSEHDAHRQADGHTHDHLLKHRGQGLRVGQADHRLIRHAGLRADGDQHRQRHPRAHRHRARREDRRAGEHRQNAQERPEHGRNQRHDVGFSEGGHIRKQTRAAADRREMFPTQGTAQPASPGCQCRPLEGGGAERRGGCISRWRSSESTGWCCG